MENLILLGAWLLGPIFLATFWFWFLLIFCPGIISGKYFKKEYEGSRTPFLLLDIFSDNYKTSLGILYIFCSYGMSYMLYVEGSKGQYFKGSLEYYLVIYLIFIGTAMLFGLLGYLSKNKINQNNYKIFCTKCNTENSKNNLHGNCIKCGINLDYNHYKK